MSKPTELTPLQKLVNTNAIRRAEQQYRLATLFTPFGFQPEQIDFERVAVFLADPERAFPNPSEGISNALVRIKAQLVEASAVIEAFAAQNVHPTLTDAQVYQTALANVTGNRMNTAAYAAA